MMGEVALDNCSINVARTPGEDGTDLCDLSPAERCPGGQGCLLFQVCVHISSLRMLGLRMQQDIVSTPCRERGSRGCVGQA